MQFHGDRCACALIAGAGGAGGDDGFSDISIETHEDLRRSLVGLLKAQFGRRLPGARFPTSFPAFCPTFWKP